MIHSKDDNPKTIFDFARQFKKSKYFRPLVAVPSTYSKTKESELIKNGFRIVIYANQLLRGSYNSMVDTAEKILKFQRAHEVEKNICSIKKILRLIKD